MGKIQWWAAATLPSARRSERGVNILAMSSRIAVRLMWLPTRAAQTDALRVSRSEMTPERKGILLILIGILVLEIVVFLLPFSERRFEGKTLSEWIDHSREDVGSKHLARALRAMGPKIIPILVEDLFATDSKLKLTLVELQRKQSIVDIPFPSAYERHANALIGLRAVRGEPQLEAIVPLILQRLKTTKDLEFRYHLFDSLACIGPQAREAIPFLLTSLTDTNKDIRVSSAAVLGEIRGKPGRVVLALMAALHDPDRGVRNITLGALSSFGAEAKAAIPAVLEIAGKHPDLSNRETAVQALRKIDPAAAEEGAAAYLDSLIAGIKDSNWKTRRRTLAHLLQLPQKPVGFLKAALEALDDENERVREEAALLLGNYGKQAQVALPKLRQLAAGDPDRRTRKSADRALQQIEPAWGAAIPQ
jgi:hypothetical protein